MEADGGALTVTGQIKWFDAHKGYGFITPDGPQADGDILLHQTCVRQSGFRQPVEGALVVCEAVKGPRGLQASRILSLDNSTAQVMAQSSERSPRYVAEPHGHLMSLFIWRRCAAAICRNCRKARRSRYGWATARRANWWPRSPSWIIKPLRTGFWWCACDSRPLCVSCCSARCF
jgi:cold shock CspA family protein